MKEYTVALAGNPNVGKSTVFNALTGLKQHTGNWPGKTVEQASGTYECENCRFQLVDLPGTYSLSADSPEEVIARDFICSGQADVTLVVTDATCLRRNLHLAVQIRQITPRMVLCVNLLDEAEKKGIRVDLPKLSQQLGVPVVGTAARSGKGLGELTAAVCRMACTAQHEDHWRVDYGAEVERHIAAYPFLSRIQALSKLQQGKFRDSITASQIRKAEELADSCMICRRKNAHSRDRKLDRILTSKRTGIPAMLLLLAGIFYLTIWGANYPSAWLSKWLFALQTPLRNLLSFAPWWVQGAVADGIYRTVAWVVSVMLPPMAIFFPLFTLLEDAGYLPRVAFNLDRFFCAAGAHGRQSLTMCMGFGCNACGVTGCRIIDSERERLVAILTNSFVPCNGRFPTLIVLISLFFLGGTAGLGRSLLATVIFLTAIIFAVGMTLLASRLLTATLLRGETSSFSLELPPYRMPQFGRVLVRSLLDRTLFVLGRAVTVAAPAGLLIWILANVSAGDTSLLAVLAAFFDPLGRLMGLDGMIVLAFILGFPANEIVLPILLMGYLQTGSLTAYTGLEQLRQILLANGWSGVTALCMMLICLLHFPCGTTCLTVYRETGSLKWTAVGFWLPTLMGMILCMTVHFLSMLFM